MACLAGSLLVAVLTIRFWPLPADDGKDIVYHVKGQEVIEMDEIIPTEQARKQPPPPAPIIPLIVPEDVVIEEYDFDIAENFLDIEEPSEDVEIVEANDTATSTRAETSPKPVRFVEPEYTREAQRKNIRAQVVVEVLVDERGRVQDAKILERFLLGKEDTPEPVAELGYGLEEAAVAAAERWMFRPARQNGKPVRSYYQLTISFGV
jgi:protein TonB